VADVAKPVTVAVVEKPTHIPKVVEVIQQVAEVTKPAVVAVVNDPGEVPKVVEIVKPAVEAVKPIVIAVANNPTEAPSKVASQTPTTAKVESPSTNTPHPSPRLRRRSDSNIIPASPVPAIFLTKPDRKPSKLSMSYNPYDDPNLGPAVNETSPQNSGSRWHQKPRRSKMKRLVDILGCEPPQRDLKRLRKRDRIRALQKRMVSVYVRTVMIIIC